MNRTPGAHAGRAPWHLWLVGVLSLLWNGVGAVDYFMTQTRNEAYLGSFTPEQLAYFQSFPAWAVACWAMSVWGGVLGAALLLARRRLAAPVFLVSLVTMLPMWLYNYVLTDGLRLMGGAGALAFSAAIFVVALGLWLYARRLADTGVLR